MAGGTAAASSGAAFPPAAITAGFAPAAGTAAWGVPLQRDVRKAAALVREALAYLGRPYQWAGIGRRGFDCSGLVFRVFGSFGVALPHSSWEQYSAGRAVSTATLLPGDVVFFRTYTAGPSHVGIYLGRQRFIPASASRGVIVSSLDEPYYRSRYLGARRY
jgi:cell wall-associated NlpC family hydrolase